MRHLRSNGGYSPPNPSASIPPGKGLTPEGDNKKCETLIDNEQSLHGYMAGFADTLRHKVGYSAENFSRIRRLALNLLRRDKTCKNGLKGKRLKARLKQDYLLRIVRQGI